ncbi:hypothetical protein TNCV_2980471 [Trichonephila clavipes]|nr:hypothetical protein TNCV_2980471 [Trichonephila clavipes]
MGGVAIYRVEVQPVPDYDNFPSFSLARTRQQQHYLLVCSDRYSRFYSAPPPDEWEICTCAGFFNPITALQIFTFVGPSPCLGHRPPNSYKNRDFHQAYDFMFSVYLSSPCSLLSTF